MKHSDVELTRTVDIKEKDKLQSLLVKGGISYLEKWEKVPLLRRRDYYGAKEVCAIYVNENQKAQADKILNSLQQSGDSRKKIKNGRSPKQPKVKKHTKGQNRISPESEVNAEEWGEAEKIPNNSGSNDYIENYIVEHEFLRDAKLPPIRTRSMTIPKSGNAAPPSKKSDYDDDWDKEWDD